MAEQQQSQTFGVTPPISLSLPTLQEKQSNDAMLAELRRQGTFESPLETQTREEVLARLQEITNKFVKMVAAKRSKDNKVLIRDARGVIFTYGSYRLGVFGPGSDIDTICIAPAYVEVSDFFQYFPDLLSEMTKAGEIKNVHPVPTAFVPIIKFEYRGVSIDLIFSSIKSMQQLPANKNWSLQDVNVLRGLNEQLVASLNGPRVTDDLLRCVPEQGTFKLALRAIKLWAKRRALYGAIYGYPGGVAWAILVARVCQLYPKATASIVVNRFFWVLRRWNWPEPVLLKQMRDHNLGLRNWNPVLYPGDARHIMPIITPSYPAFCTTHNVTESALVTIQSELERAFVQTTLILEGKRPWRELFEKHTFFTKDHKFYLAIIASSRTKEAHKAWAGFVESQSRKLAMDVDRNQEVLLARPYVQVFDRVHRCKTEAQIAAVVDGKSTLDFVIKGAELEKAEQEMERREGARKEAEKQEMERKETQEDGVTTESLLDHANVKSKLEPEIDPVVEAVTMPLTNSETNGITPIKSEAADEGLKLAEIAPVKNNVEFESGEEDKQVEPEETLIYTSTQYIGLVLPEGCKSLNISYACNKFVRNCTAAGDKCLPGISQLKIQTIKAINLPDDVFEPGETRPRPTGKKRIAPSEPERPAKRTAPAEEVQRGVRGLHVSATPAG